MNTFEAHGETWTTHKPGDPCPIDKETAIRILDRDGQKWSCDKNDPFDSGWWSDVYSNPIIGWHLAITIQENSENIRLSDEITDDQVNGWISRTSWDGSYNSAVTAIDDARSLHNS